MERNSSSRLSLFSVVSGTLTFSVQRPLLSTIFRGILLALLHLLLQCSNEFLSIIASVPPSSVTMLFTLVDGCIAIY